MVPLDPGGGIAVEGQAGQARGVAVDQLARLLGGHQLVQHHVVSVHHPGEVHELPQAQDLVPPDGLGHLGGVDDRPRMLEGGCGDTGGEHELHIQGGVLRRRHHIVQAADPADVDDLMGVGDDGGAPMGDQQPAQLLRGEVRGLDVDMAVDEAGDGIPPAGVHLFLSGVGAHTGDLAAAQGDVPLDELSGEHIEDLAVLDHSVRRDGPSGGLDQLFQRFFRHIMPPSASGWGRRWSDSHSPPGPRR